MRSVCTSSSLHFPPFVVSVNVDSYLTGKRHMHLLIRTVQTYSHFRHLSSFFIFILASLSHHHILINKNREVIIVFKKIFCPLFNKKLL